MTGKQLRTLLTYLAGVFIAALDQNIVAPALTSIVREFNVPTQWGAWGVSAYTLVYATSMPLTAKLADGYGRKKIFMTGMGLFALGSLLAGLAPNLFVFLAGRAIQALGGGGIFPIAVAQIGLAFGQEKRGKALGLFGATHGLASVSAPILGGWIVQHYSWQWLFLINIPVVFLILFMALGLEREMIKKVPPLDWKGGLLVSIIIFGLMLGLSHLKGELGWQGFFSPTVYPFVMISLLLIPSFIGVERRSPNPVVDLSFFYNRQLRVVFLVATLAGAVLMSSLFLPAFVELFFHIAPGKAAYYMIPMAIASIVTSPLGGAIADRWGARKTILLGFANTLAGGLILAGVAWGIDHLSVALIAFLLLGAGLGFVIGSPLNLMVMEEVNCNKVSSGLAVMGVIRSLGTTIAPIIMGSMISANLAFGQGELGFQLLFLFTSSLSLLGLFLTLGLRKGLKRS